MDVDQSRGRNHRTVREFPLYALLMPGSALNFFRYMIRHSSKKADGIKRLV